MKTLKYVWVLGLTFLMAQMAQAQTPQQGTRQGFNPGQMVEAEKKAVYEKITTLTDDQKEVIDMIYADYSESFGKAREEANGDFQAMRTKMMTLREEKDKSMKEVLNEDQYKEYTALMEELRQRRTRGN